MGLCIKRCTSSVCPCLSEYGVWLVTYSKWDSRRNFNSNLVVSRVRLRLQFLALWTIEVKRIGKTIVWFLLHVIRDWTPEEVIDWLIDWLKCYWVETVSKIEYKWNLIWNSRTDFWHWMKIDVSRYHGIILPAYYFFSWHERALGANKIIKMENAFGDKRQE